MALDVTLVSPYIPVNSPGGGVADGKAIFINSGSPNRFAVVDPGGSIRAFSFTPPAGGGSDCRGGVSDGVSVWTAFGNSLWMGRFWPDGTVDMYPSTFTVAFPYVVAAGSDIWVVSTSGSQARRFNRTTLTWDTSMSATVGSLRGMPVYLGGSIWAWTTGGLRKIDPATGTVTAVTTTGITGPKLGGQVAVAGGTAWWPADATGRLVKLTATTVENVDTGVTFGNSLCFDSGGFLRSCQGDGSTLVGYHPITGQAWAESTGMSGGYNQYLIFTVGGKTIAGIGS